MHSLSHEAAILLVMCASAAAAAESTPAHELGFATRAWCLFGASLGAVCSLHFCRIKKTKTLREDIAWQFAVNLILSAVFSPFLVPTVQARLGVGAADAGIATGLVVGMLAQKFVKDYALPFFRSWAEWRSAQIALKLGMPESKGVRKRVGHGIDGTDSANQPGN